MHNEEEIVFVETTEVKEGVVCDIYRYKGDDSKDLGIVKVSKGFQTPKQQILDGLKTLEIFKTGKGKLSVIKKDGSSLIYSFPGNVIKVELQVGDIMQWTAHEDLVFYEVCYPPYREGRFKSLLSQGF